MSNLYQGISAKNCSIDERGQSKVRVHLQSLEQKMMPIKEWLAFFNNIKNKQHLFSADEFVQPSPLPILVNNKNQALKISFKWNCKEVDPKMIFHMHYSRKQVQ